MDKKNISTRLKAAIESDPPNFPAVLELLNRPDPIAHEIADVLREGLAAKKSIALDGEIFGSADYPTRHKYAETILRLLGELDGKSDDKNKSGEMHFHFTAIQLSKKSEDDLLSTLMGRTNAITQRKPDPTGNDPARVREEKIAA